MNPAIACTLFVVCIWIIALAISRTSRKKLHTLDPDLSPARAVMFSLAYGDLSNLANHLGPDHYLTPILLRNLELFEIAIKEQG